MNHVAVVGLGFGDEGKGTIVDYLTRSAPCAGTTVVRFNGGAQAAHNVVKPDGRHHTFAQFGSGTLNGADTFLSRFMLVDPLRLAAESDHLRELIKGNPFDLLTIDHRALIITPFHALYNQKKETERGDKAHGTTGVGIGETVDYSLSHPSTAPRVMDCRDPRRLKLLLEDLSEWYGIEQDIDQLVTAYSAFAEAVNITDKDYYLGGLLNHENVIFEGAQGVLLDETFGFAPHNTWSNTTFDNADRLVREQGFQRPKHIGVMRSYMTRHGAGPFPTQDDGLTLPESHNNASGWAGQFRVGHRDLWLHQYAAAVVQPLDSIAITHMDAESPEIRTCYSYGSKWGATIESAKPKYDSKPWIPRLEAPVSIMSFGPTENEKETL